MAHMKNQQPSKHIFEFDLEKDLKNDVQKKNELLEEVGKQKHALKTRLRQGANETEFEQLGQLLQAYEALERVVKNIKG